MTEHRAIAAHRSSAASAAARLTSRRPRSPQFRSSTASKCRNSSVH